MQLYLTVKTTKLYHPATVQQSLFSAANSRLLIRVTKILLVLAFSTNLHPAHAGLCRLGLIDSIKHGTRLLFSTPYRRQNRLQNDFNSSPNRSNELHVVRDEANDTVRLESTSGRFNPDSEIDVVAFHGIGMNISSATSWAQSMLAFLSPTSKYRKSQDAVELSFEAPGLPGVKTGPRRSKFKTVDDAVNWLEKYMESYQKARGSTKPTVFLTRSSWAMFAVKLAKKRPDLVQGLIIMSPNPPGNTPEAAARIKAGRKATEAYAASRNEAHTLDHEGLDWFDEMAVNETEWTAETFEGIPTVFLTGAKDIETIPAERKILFDIAMASNGNVRIMDFLEGEHNPIQSGSAARAIDEIYRFLNQKVLKREVPSDRGVTVSARDFREAYLQRGIGNRGWFGLNPKMTPDNEMAALDAGAMFWSQYVKVVASMEEALAHQASLSKINDDMPRNDVIASPIYVIDPVLAKKLKDLDAENKISQLNTQMKELKEAIANQPKNKAELEAELAKLDTELKAIQQQVVKAYVPSIQKSNQLYTHNNSGELVPVKSADIESTLTNPKPLFVKDQTGYRPASDTEVEAGKAGQIEIFYSNKKGNIERAEADKIQYMVGPRRQVFKMDESGNYAEVAAKAARQMSTESLRQSDKEIFWIDANGKQHVVDSDDLRQAGYGAIVSDHTANGLVLVAMGWTYPAIRGVINIEKAKQESAYVDSINYLYGSYHRKINRAAQTPQTDVEAFLVHDANGQLREVSADEADKIRLNRRDFYIEENGAYRSATEEEITAAESGEPRVFIFNKKNEIGAVDPAKIVHIRNSKRIIFVRKSGGEIKEAKPLDISSAKERVEEPSRTAEEAVTQVKINNGLLDQGFTVRYNQDINAVLTGLKNQPRKNQSDATNRFLDPDQWAMTIRAFLSGRAETVELYDPNGNLVAATLVFKIGNVWSCDSVTYPFGKKRVPVDSRLKDADGKDFAIDRMDGKDLMNAVMTLSLQRAEQLGQTHIDVQMVTSSTAAFGADYVEVNEFNRIVEEANAVGP